MPTKEEWKDVLDAMKDQHQANEQGGKKTWKPPSDKEGMFPIRILPPLKKLGEKLPYFPHKVHWVGNMPYECTNQTLVDKNGNLHEAEHCPVCSFARKLYQQSERGTEDWILAGRVNAKTAYIYRVIVRNSEDETKPEFYEAGKMIHDIIYGIIMSSDYGVIFDPKSGRDLNIKKNGTGRNSRYEQTLPAAKETPMFSDVEKMKKALTNAMEMKYNSLIEFVSADTLKSLLMDFLGMKEKTPNKKKESAKPVVEEPEEDNDDSEIDDLVNEMESESEEPEQEAEEEDNSEIDDILKELEA